MITKGRCVLLLAVSLMLGACTKKSGSGSGTSYSFSAAANVLLSASSLMTQSSRSLKPMDSRSVDPCNNHPCFTPTAVSGKYFGVGLLIQSNGNGMSGYFGRSEWSSITGTSLTYDFDLASPLTNSGTFTCCNGTGDLASENSSYIEDVSFLLGYVDVTFTYAGSANTLMNVSHKVRFIFADDVIAGAKRGDLLYFLSTANGGSDTFEYFSADGNHSSTRPTSPITQDSAVTAWTNPWGSVGNQTIPVMYSGAVLPTSDSEKITVTQTQLASANRTYSFKFPSEDLVIFPTLLGGTDGDDRGLVFSIVTLLQKIHLQGLPHSTATLGRASDTVLTITD